MSLSVCSLQSGSNGNCTFISNGRTNLLIDCGIPLKTLEEGLYSIGVSPSSIHGVFVTHEHSDHIKSVGAISRRYGVPIFANTSTWEAMEKKIGEVRPGCIKLFSSGGDIYFSDICISTIKISHDAAEPVAFSVCDKDRKVSIVTDLGVINKGVLSFMEGSQLVFLEANHDVDMLIRCSYPPVLKQRILSAKGHLSNTDCAETILKLMDHSIRYILLSHLSKESNTPELAFATVRDILAQSNVHIGSDIMVDMTYRDHVSRVYNLI
ncbi:MAG: MBL fold metallo-hydrolase [Clostridiales bacterium]|nr:MBL fold metallo-hydrolase [Clostridiales bacterium]